MLFTSLLLMNLINVVNSRARASKFQFSKSAMENHNSQDDHPIQAQGQANHAPLQNGIRNNDKANTSVKSESHNISSDSQNSKSISILFCIRYTPYLFFASSISKFVLFGDELSVCPERLVA